MSGEEWGAIRGLMLRNLKGLKGRSRKTGGNMDQHDGHGNVERCLDHEKTGNDVKEKSRGWHQPEEELVTKLRAWRPCS